MKERFVACMLGGAIGDALGYTVEFMHWPQIESWFGPGGIREAADRQQDRSCSDFR